MERSCDCVTDVVFRSENGRTVHAIKKELGTHRRFICKDCGTDWMTILTEALAKGLCQVCYHMQQPEFVDWIRYAEPHVVIINPQGRPYTAEQLGITVYPKHGGRT